MGAVRLFRNAFCADTASTGGDGDSRSWQHGSDRWKTPYNGSFSNESIYATADAPRWVGDRLKTADGRLVADETPAH